MSVLVVHPHCSGEVWGEVTLSNGNFEEEKTKMKDSKKYHGPVSFEDEEVCL